MNTILEELLHNKTALIDTSFLNAKGLSLEQQLYTSQGLSTLPSEELKRCIEYLNGVQELISKFHTFAIAEVIAETEVGEQINNEHNNFFSRNQQRGYRTGRYKPKHAKKTRELRKPWEDELEESLNDLTAYCNNFHRMVRKLKSRGDPKARFSDEQKKIYEETIHTLETYSSPQKSWLSQRDRSGLKNRREIGEEIDTDRKIIAPAFALAYTREIVILTRDNDIPKMALMFAGNTKYDGHVITVYGAANNVNGAPHAKIKLVSEQAL